MGVRNSVTASNFRITNPPQTTSSPMRKLRGCRRIAPSEALTNCPSEAPQVGSFDPLEQSVNENTNTEESAEGNVQVASVETKTVSDTQIATKRTVDMRNAATVDLLLRLTAERAERGALGSFHVVTGTCFFLDRNILKYPDPMIDLASQQQSEPRKDRSRLSAS
jgi:hypothetical protein